MASSWHDNNNNAGEGEDWNAGNDADNSYDHHQVVGGGSDDRVGRKRRHEVAYSQMDESTKRRVRTEERELKKTRARQLNYFRNASRMLHDADVAATEESRQMLVDTFFVELMRTMEGGDDEQQQQGSAEHGAVFSALHNKEIATIVEEFLLLAQARHLQGLLNLIAGQVCRLASSPTGSFVLESIFRRCFVVMREASELTTEVSELVAMAEDTTLPSGLDSIIAIAGEVNDNLEHLLFGGPSFPVHPVCSLVYLLAGKEKPLRGSQQKQQQHTNKNKKKVEGTDGGNNNMEESKQSAGTTNSFRSPFNPRCGMGIYKTFFQLCFPQLHDPSAVIEACKDRTVSIMLQAILAAGSQHRHEFERSVVNPFVAAVPELVVDRDASRIVQALLTTVAAASPKLWTSLVAEKIPPVLETLLDGEKCTCGEFIITDIVKTCPTADDFKTIVIPKILQPVLQHVQSSPMFAATLIQACNKMTALGISSGTEAKDFLVGVCVAGKACGSKGAAYALLIDKAWGNNGVELCRVLLATGHRDGVSRLVHSFDKIPTRPLIDNVACHPHGSRVLQAYIQIGATMRPKTANTGADSSDAPPALRSLLNKLKTDIDTVATNASGTYVLEALYDAAADAAFREDLVKSLLLGGVYQSVKEKDRAEASKKGLEKLLANACSRPLATHLRLEQYLYRPDEWRVQHDKEAHIKRILAAVGE